MSSNTNLARSVLVASLAMLLLSSMMALSGCSQEVMRARYRWSMDGGASLAWSRQQVAHPDNLQGGGGEIYCISAADAEHVWATRNGGEIDALDNGSWKQVFVTHPADFLLGVSALDSKHVWVVGQEEDHARQSHYAAIWFFDGTSWKQQAAREFKGVSLHAVYALGTKHVWAVGTGGTILYFDGSSWTRQESGTRVELDSVSAVNHSQVWAAGIDDVGRNSALLFYNGTSWNKRNPGNGRSFYIISAIDASQVWALGGSAHPGDIGVYCFNGSSWVLSLQASAPEFVPSGVCALASNHIWATGTGYGPNGPIAEVAFFDGRSWNIRQTDVEPGIGFGFVSAADPSHLWAVGRDMVPTAGISPNPSEIYFGTDQQ